MADRATFEAATAAERREVFNRLDNSYLERKSWHPLDWAKIGIASGMSVVDIGSGSGAFLFDLDSTYPGQLRLLGIDPAADFVEWAASSAVAENIDFEVATLDDVTESGKRFDVVHISQAIFGMGPVGKTLEKLCSILNKEGILIVQDTDFDFFRLWPEPEAWTELISRIQARSRERWGLPQSARMLLPELHKFGLRDIDSKISVNNFSLQEGAFSTLHTFFPKEQQAAVSAEIARYVKYAEWGYTSMFAVWGRKP